MKRTTTRAFLPLTTFLLSWVNIVFRVSEQKLLCVRFDSFYVYHLRQSFRAEPFHIPARWTYDLLSAHYLPEHITNNKPNPPSCFLRETNATQLYIKLSSAILATNQQQNAVYEYTLWVHSFLLLYLFAFSLAL